MNKTKQTIVFGFALFAGFFGAGNLILPPLLGFKAGEDWWLVASGFMVTTTIIPFFAIKAHAKLQGTMYDFGLKLSPIVSTIFCFLVYALIIALPCPRTAAVTHEIAVAPFFNISPLLTSIVYFVIAFFFAINRNNVLDILGKYLTPIIVVILLGIILIGIINQLEDVRPASFKFPIINGLLEGYQTYDAIAGMVTGGIIIVSINNINSKLSFNEKKRIITNSGVIAITGLFIIYAGLIAIGAFYNTQFDSTISRTDLLTGLASKTLGSIGSVFLSVLVALACFTTAVAIIVSIADFAKAYFKRYNYAYLITVIFCCLIGILVGRMNVKYIIDIALPVLMFIYPICIVLILLNIVPDRIASKLVFRWVVLVASVFSIPDVLGFIAPSNTLNMLKQVIPLGNENLGWVLPVILTFIIVNVFEKLRHSD